MPTPHRRAQAAASWAAAWIGLASSLVSPLLPAVSGLATVSAIATIAAGAASAAEHGSPAASEGRRGAPGAPTALEEPEGLKAIKYRLIGPAWGGRASQVAGVAGNPNLYYLAAASGGVWKSTDGGLTWNPIFDDQPVASIGALAVAPSDANVIYVGSGEANIRGNISPGNGIYRSLDAGKTWSHVWTQTGQIGALAVHPRNPEVAFAAVLGHAFGPNPERGVYRTQDAGRTWQQVLKQDPDTGASDVAIDPSNPSIVFAGLWQARRYPWGLTSGGPGSGLWLSRDGGDTWKQLTGRGLPSAPWGKVGVAVAPSDGRRVYALIEAAEGGLYRSDDGGDSWTLASGNHELRQRAFYYTRLTVSPVNPDEVWFPQVTLLHTIDGGKTLKHVTSVHHGDHHDIWVDPRNPKRVAAANDGGVDLSTNGGESWSAPPIPIGQLYHVSVDTRVPFSVAGALQDIGSCQGPSNSLTAGGIYNSEWYSVGGGEAGFVVSDPLDPAIVYAGEYGGYISRYDRRTRQTHNVSVYPDNPSGHGGEDLTWRFQWTAPIALSPHDPKVLYHAANVLFRSADSGQSWAPISPDLTRNDRSKQGWSGGPITGDNTGVEIYCTIFAVAESPRVPGLIWVGSDDGLVHLTRDGGKTWQDVTAAVPGLPQWATVTTIEPSHHEDGAAYLIADAHRLDDPRPYLWKTSDYGKSWRRLDGGLPRDVHLHAVREDPVRQGLLFAGSDKGVAFSLDDGATWRSLKLNLPTVAVHDMAIKEGSLVLATHGRSFWIFDDLALLRGLPAPVAAAVGAHAPTTARASEHTKPRESAAPADHTRESAAPFDHARLLLASDAVRWSLGPADGLGWTGENPPAGAYLYYQLPAEPKGDITLEILDARGKQVTSLSSKVKEATGASEIVELEEDALKKQALAKEPGIQRAVWDLTWAGAEMIPGARLDSGNPAQGPRALPGVYTARLTVEGQTTSATFRVLPDPRVRASAEDLAAQLGLALELREQITRLTRDVLRLRSVRQQLGTRNTLLKDVAKAEPLRQAAAELEKKLDLLEARFHNPKAEIVYDILAQKGGAQVYSRLAPLLSWVEDGDSAPTQGMRTTFLQEKAELDRSEAELDALLAGDLANLNATAGRLGLPSVWMPAGASPPSP